MFPLVALARFVSSAGTGGPPENHRHLSSQRVVGGGAYGPSGRMATDSSAEEIVGTPFDGKSIERPSGA
jgi:hypothetical protein